METHMQFMSEQNKVRPSTEKVSVSAPRMGFKLSRWTRTGAKGVKDTSVMACCHFVCRPNRIRTTSRYPLPKLFSGPPTEYFICLREWNKCLSQNDRGPVCEYSHSFLWRVIDYLVYVYKQGFFLTYPHGTHKSELGHLPFLLLRKCVCVCREKVDCDTQSKYTISPERLATDLSPCNMSLTRLKLLKQELLGVSPRIKADCVRGPHASHDPEERNRQNKS